MQVSSSHQIYVFLLFILLGIVCGVIFDTQRFFRKKFFAGTVRTTIEDVVFALFCVGIMLASSFMFNNGEIRYYQGMGALSGILFYTAFLSSVFQKILSVLFGVTEKLIIRPIVKTAFFLGRPVKKFALNVKRHLARAKRKLASVRKSAKKRKKIIKKRIKML